MRIVLNEYMLLSTLGQRLRKQRQHNYTQHDLAQQAGVSNRFSHSSLKNGTGNISVLRLANVCAVLELPLSELFQGSARMGYRSSHWLVCVGPEKSTVGRALSARMGLRFVELNELVTADAAIIFARDF